MKGFLKGFLKCLFWISIFIFVGFILSLIPPWHKSKVLSRQYIFTISPSFSLSTAESADAQQRILLIPGVKKCILERDKVTVDIDAEKEFDFKEAKNVIAEAVIEILTDHLRKKITKFSIIVSYSISTTGMGWR